MRRALLDEVLVDVPHAEAGRIEHVLRDWVTHHDAVLDDVAYAATVTFTLLVPRGRAPRSTRTRPRARAAQAAVGTRVADLR